MDSPSISRRDLDRAYRRAVYRVELDAGPVELRIGEGSPALDRHLAASGATSWAIVTACNPGSAPLAPEQNRGRTAELARRLAREGRPVRPSTGIDPDRRWPDEPGFLVEDVPLAAAVALAAELGQAAIVVGRRGAAAQLVWIGEPVQAPPGDAL